MSKKIVVTGGHATPALATIEELKKSNAQIYWLGEKEAISGSDSQTLEYQLIPQLGIPFYSISSTKLHKEDIFKTILNIWKIPFGVLQSLALLAKLKPNCLLSFGSYVAVPPVFAAWLLNIPIVTHEQTTVPGLANKIVSLFAKKIAITFPITGSFDKSKVVLTGNPTRVGFFKKSSKKNSGLQIFVTGGSRGAHVINVAVLEVLPQLLEKYRVYHQTGSLDFDAVSKAKLNLAPNLSKNYHIAANYNLKDFEDTMSSSNLVVSRAGANTVLEIAALGIPAILIPIPWSGGGEQVKNAEVLKNSGLAKILDQEHLNGKKLLECIEDLFKNPPDKSAKVKAKELARPKAAKSLANLVLETAKNE